MIAQNATSTRAAATKIFNPLAEEFVSIGAFFLTKASFLFDSKITEAASSTAEGSSSLVSSEDCFISSNTRFEGAPDLLPTLITREVKESLVVDEVEV